MNTTTEKAVLKLQRTFPASRERLFAAWTDPDQMRKWFGPAECTAEDVQMDLRVGGAYRFAMKTPRGEFVVHGVFREVAPPGRLVYTWQWEDDPDYTDRETLVTIEFVEKGGSTEIRLTHENLPSAESIGNHEHGWTGTLENLEKYLSA